MTTSPGMSTPQAPDAILRGDWIRHRTDYPERPGASVRSRWSSAVAHQFTGDVAWRATDWLTLTVVCGRDVEGPRDRGFSVGSVEVDDRVPKCWRAGELLREIDEAPPLD